MLCQYYVDAKFWVRALDTRHLDCEFYHARCEFKLPDGPPHFRLLF